MNVMLIVCCMCVVHFISLGILSINSSFCSQIYLFCLDDNDDNNDYEILFLFCVFAKIIILTNSTNTTSIKIYHTSKIARIHTLSPP